MDIPGYEIGECLLRTARVTLHRGRRTADGAPVLLKRPEENTLLGPDAEALLREHSFLLTVSARGFPRALEVVRTSGSAWLVIEDSGLRSLATLLAAGPLDLAVALRIALQVSAILAELHRRGFVHGAVQPAALLASEDGAGVQLLEANVAARAPADLRTLVATGCAPYMSPEQTGRINREIDYRTDFYSLGATLYELIAGRPPFPADDPLELVHAHIARPPAPLSTLVATVPDPLARVVERLLAKAPEDRYQSAT